MSRLRPVLVRCLLVVLVLALALAHLPPLHATGATVQCAPSPPLPALWACEITDTSGSAFGVAVGSLGEIYVVGQVAKAKDATDLDAWLARFNASGGLVWEKRLDDNKFDRFLDVGVDSEGNVYVLGSLNGYRLLKFDSQGNEHWRTASGALPGLSLGTARRALAVHPDGSSAVGGRTSGQVNVRRFDTDGNPGWSTSFDSGTPASDLSYALVGDGTGAVFVAGRFGVQDGTIRVPFVSMLSASGEQGWLRTLDSLGNSALPNALALDGAGRLLLGGAKGPGWLAALDGDGVVEWVQDTDQISAIQDVAADSRRGDPILAVGQARGVTNQYTLSSFAPTGSPITNTHLGIAIEGVAVEPLDGSVYVAGSSVYGSLVGGTGDAPVLIKLPGNRPRLVWEGFGAGFCVKAAQGQARDKNASCGSGESPIEVGVQHPPAVGETITLEQDGGAKAQCNLEERDNFLFWILSLGTHPDKAELVLRLLSDACTGEADRTAIRPHQSAQSAAGMELSLQTGAVLFNLHALSPSLVLSTTQASVVGDATDSFAVSHDASANATTLFAYTGAVTVTAANTGQPAFALGPAQSVTINEGGVGPIHPLAQIFLPAVQR